MLVSILIDRDAHLVEKGHYTDVFEISGRSIELSHNVQSLEDTLAHFDIALSTIAVEHPSHGEWQSVIYPLA